MKEDVLATENYLEMLKLNGFHKDEVDGMRFHKNSLYANDVSNEDMLRYANLGYSKEYILSMDETEKELLEGLEGVLVSVDKGYYRVYDNEDFQEISGDQYNDETSEYELNNIALSSLCTPSTSITTTPCFEEKPMNWITLKTAVARIANTSPQEYIIVHEFRWHNRPSQTHKDAIGVSTPSDLTRIQNSEYLRYSYDVYSLNSSFASTRTFEETKNNYFYTANTASGGYGFEFNLQRGSCDAGGIILGKCTRFENHNGALAFRAVKSSTTLTSTFVSGHYIHTTQSTTVSLGISFPWGVTMAISANVNHTKANDTYVSFKV